MVIEKANIYIVIGGTQYDATILTDGWQDWEVEHSRAVFGQSEKTVSFSLAFTGDARTRLINLYNTYYQNAQALLRIVEIDTSNTYEYDLDFSTYEKDDNYVRLACRVQDLFTLIKKNGRTEYDLDFNNIRNQKKMQYQRIMLDNIVYMRRAEMDYQQSVYHVSSGRYPGLSYSESDTPVKDSIWYNDVLADSSYTLDADRPYEILRTGKYTIRYESESDATGISIGFSNIADRGTFDNWMSGKTYRVHYVLSKFVTTGEEGEGSTTETILKETIYNMANLPTASASALARYYAHTNIVAGTNLVTWTGTLNTGDRIAFRIRIIVNPATSMPIYSSPIDVRFSYCGFGNLIAEYTAVNPNNKIYSVAKLDSILEALFDKMGAENVTVNFSSNNNVANRVLLPHDVINGYTLPTMTVSYNKIESYLKFMCHGITIEGNTVTISHLFGTDGIYNRYPSGNTGITLTEEQCVDLTEEPYTEVVYSEIQLAYEANTQEGVNMKYEFNRTTNYTTGANTTNKLTLTCPFCCGNIGLELDIPEKEKDSNERKKTIYVVDCTENVDFFSPRTLNIGNRRIINTYFYPITIMLRNDQVIGMSGDVFMQVSTDMVQEPSTSWGYNYGNVSRYRMSMLAPDFLPTTYTLNTSDDKNLILRSTLAGLLTYNYKGETVTTYVQKIAENPLLRQEKEYSLIKINNSGYITFNFGIVKRTKKFTISSAAQDNISIQFDVVGMAISNSASQVIIGHNPAGAVRNGKISGNSNRVTYTFSVTANTGSRNRTIGLFAYINGIKYNVSNITQLARQSQTVSLLPDESASFTANDEIQDKAYVIIMNNQTVTQPLPTLQDNFMSYGTFTVNSLPYGISQLVSTSLDSENQLIKVQTYGRNANSGRMSQIYLSPSDGSWTELIQINFT